ncbi:MAG: hypothetical protein WAV15_00440 [Minisyncoccia bacterium]
MSKTLISVVLVAAVVVGGYLALKSKSPVENPPAQNEEAVKDASGKKMAFSELVKQGGSYKCEVKQSMSDFENSGTVYMSGNKLSGQFSTVAEGTTMESYFVMKDGYMYNWSSFAPNMGIKIKTEAAVEAEAQGTYSWSAEQVGDYDCQAWTPEDSRFELPSAVVFTEFKSQ